MMIDIKYFGKKENLSKKYVPISFGIVYVHVYVFIIILVFVCRRDKAKHKIIFVIRFSDSPTSKS